MKLALWITVSLATATIVALLGFAALPLLTAERVGWDAPLSREEALRRLDITYSFPESARDIYLHLRREGTQQNFLYVRFKVNPAEVERHIEDITRTFRIAFPEQHTYRIALPSEFAPTVGWFPPPPRWWQAPPIQHGYVIRFDGGVGPVFWFDTDRDILYHYELS